MSDDSRLPAEKLCGRCQEVQPAGEFHRRARSRDGLQAFCKTCHRASKRQWRAENPERDRASSSALYQANREAILARHARWRQEHREQTREKNREWREKNRNRIPGYYLKHAYGITFDEYQTMLMAQEGKCAICREPCKVHSRLSVDHCHETQEIRGLLCLRCNSAIGLLNEDPSRLRAAADYLARSRR
ncbi:endonuclease VII domain-containing protein [Streptomyces wuyuanensis]|uniref:endonuclease VII domain-containing protein n=1 Tax=Streptomyces wuyuanensis TaxID=1196353 RepID=UPI0034299048